MRRTQIIILIFAAVFLVAACENKKKETVLNIDGYKKWRKPLNKILDYPVPGHGGTFRIIYANDQAFHPMTQKDVVIEKKREYRDGTVIVKEVYKTRKEIGKKEPELTIMVKDSMNPDSIQGWFFYLKKPGEKAVVVNSRMCIGCHEAANDSHPYFDENPDGIFRDYVFVRIGQ